MVELITRSGKKIGKISDSINVDDTILVNGQSISLSDAYEDDKIVKTFNKEVKALKLKDESN